MKYLLSAVFIVAYGSEIDHPHVPATPIVNTNIQYLWSVPLQKVHFFPTTNHTSDEGFNPLLPPWMREDLNLVAIEMYKRFLAHADFSNVDPRDAESTVRLFREFQRKRVVNGTEWASFFEGENMSEDLGKALRSTKGFQNLLGKVSTEFFGRMGFSGGSRFLYQARMWAEVLGPGDAVQPQNVVTDGAVAAGAVFTHIPKGTQGTPVVELLDPRGHNPPFGKDEHVTAQEGMGLMFPAWVNRMTPPHKWEPPATQDEGEIDELLKNHRIDWVFEIGLFKYEREVLIDFVDLENCPFQSAPKQIAAQNFYNLDVPELLKLTFQNAMTNASLMQGSN